MATEIRQPRLMFRSALFCLLAVVLFLLSVTLDARTSFFNSFLIPAVIVSVVGFLLFQLFHWRDERRRRLQIDSESHAKEREFGTVFEHTFDAILTLDDQSVCLAANPAACHLLGAESSQFAGRHFGTFFPDREDFAREWQAFLASGNERGQTRLIRPDGITVFVEYTATANYVPGRHILILSDTTRHKHAESLTAESLAADSARSEAEALRRAALALTQNLAMDSVLDTLLACVADIVPYDSACVLFVENDLHLLVARERPRRLRRMEAFVLDSSQHPVLQRILVEKRAFHVADTKNEPSWTGARILPGARSWMGLPLIAGGDVLGIMSIAASSADTFSSEHFRMAKSLAIPAAVGILNARAQERAAIYASELEVQLKEQHQMRRALRESRAEIPRS